MLLDVKCQVSEFLVVSSHVQRTMITSYQSLNLPEIEMILMLVLKFSNHITNR